MKKLIFIIPLILFLFKACKPDEGCVDNNQYQYQLERDLSVIPYKDFSELTFINKTTRDTSVFVGQGYVYDWGKYVTQEECPQTYNLQRRYIVFNCTKNTDKISIENTFDSPGGRIIDFSLRKYNLPLIGTYFYGNYAYDSLNLENKVYYKVKDFATGKINTQFSFLYTNTNGIIRMIYRPTNDTLDLINIKL